jgi:hypothetical protein
MDRPNTALRPLAGLIAALLCAPVAALDTRGDLPEHWQAVPDTQLAGMRGGIDFGVLVANFAIERLVRVNGEIVARTQIVMTEIGKLANGVMPNLEVLGNLSNMVQIGPGTSTGSSSGGAAPPNDMAQFAQSMAQGAQSGASSSVISAASSNGHSGPPAAASPPPPTPGATGAGGTASAVPATPAVPVAPAASLPPAATQAINGAQGAAGASSRGGGGSGAAPVASAPQAGASASPPTVTAPAPAAPPGGGSLLNAPITVAVGNTGQTIVVSGIPNASALATSIQNSVEATRIETLTSINATLSSLAALRSTTFADSLRQQAIDSIRR